MLYRQSPTRTQDRTYSNPDGDVKSRRGAHAIHDVSCLLALLEIDMPHSCRKLKLLPLQYSGQHRHCVSFRNKLLNLHLPSEVDVEEVKVKTCLHEARHDRYRVDGAVSEVSVAQSRQHRAHSCHTRHNHRPASCSR